MQGILGSKKRLSQNAKVGETTPRMSQDAQSVFVRRSDGRIADLKGMVACVRGEGESQTRLSHVLAPASNVFSKLQNDRKNASKLTPELDATTRYARDHSSYLQARSWFVTSFSLLSCCRIRAIASNLKRRRVACQSASRLFWRIEGAKTGIAGTPIHAVFRPSFWTLLFYLSFFSFSHVFRAQ